MHHVIRHCGVCGKPFRAWNTLSERYCTAPCKVAARNRAERKLRAKFRANLVANGRAVNPHWRGSTRKRILVPGRAKAEAMASAHTAEVEAERIRKGTPDPWE